MIQSLAISNNAKSTSPYPLKGDLLQCIDHAKRIGYDGVELHLGDAKYYDWHEVADYAARMDMKITSISTGSAYSLDGHYMTNPDAEARRTAQQVLIDFLEVGKILGGASVGFGIMKGPMPKGGRAAQYTEILFESLKPVVEAAEKVGTDIVVEAINRFQSDYLCTAEDTLDFVNRFQSDRVKIHLDTFHINIEDKDMEQAIRLCKDKLGYFHFSDSDRCYPGHGHVDYKMVVDTLYDIGYAQEGVGGHEYNSIPDGVTAAVKGLEHIKQFIRE